MDRVLSALLALAFFAGAAPIVDAQTARQVSQKIEASILITGHVDIDRDGTVSGHAFDQSEKLPAHTCASSSVLIGRRRCRPVFVLIP